MKSSNAFALTTVAVALASTVIAAAALACWTVAVIMILRAPAGPGAVASPRPTDPMALTTLDRSNLERQPSARYDLQP